MPGIGGTATCASEVWFSHSFDAPKSGYRGGGVRSRARVRKQCGCGFVRCARQRRAGLRHRPARRRLDLAARLLGPGGGDADRQQPRRDPLPRRHPGRRLPRAPRHHRRDLRAVDGHDDQSAPPNTAIYNQSIPSDGYGYMSTRDGTKLAYSVHPPTDVTNAEGGLDLPPALTSQLSSPLVPGVKSPTLVEYSGYGYAKPDGPVSGIAALANLMGFTVVDVNMRGTGCSSGSFDFFEPLQSLDGYDVVETVAHQPWVAHGKVGMMGISYGGISQLFTAQTQPPDLAAIAPLSVIDQTQTTLYPGGILNTGFAVDWAQERQHEAMPAGPDSGQPWAYQRIQEGDRPAPRTRRSIRRPPTCWQDPRERPLRPRGRRPALPDHLRQQDQRPGLHGLPVDRRADRRSLPDARRAHDWAPTRSGSRSRTASTPTRSIPRRTTAYTTSWSSTWTSRRRSSNRHWSRRAGPWPCRRSSGSTGPVAPSPHSRRCRPTRSSSSRPLAAPRPRSMRSPDPGPLRQRCGQLVQPGLALSELRAVVLELPDPGHHGPLVVPRSRRRARRPVGHGLRGGRVHLGCPRAAADRLHRRHRLG